MTSKLPDYERAYRDLVAEITQRLAPYLGGVPGPHPQVCKQCADNGKCGCGCQWLWIDTPEDLLFLAAEKLKGLPTQPVF